MHRSRGPSLDPPDEWRDLPPEYEALYVELEDCGVPQALLDRLEQYVCGLLSEAAQECQACLNRMAEEQQEEPPCTE